MINLDEHCKNCQFILHCDCENDEHDYKLEACNYYALANYYYNKILQIAKLSQLEKTQCQNCGFYSVSKDNIAWCRCSAGLDGNRKPTDFCSFFKIKEVKSNVK